MEDLYNEFIKQIDKTKVCLNELMCKHTTLKIGGPADIFVKIEKIEELKFVINVCRQKNVPITVIGNGSNILVKDGGIRGVVIKLQLNNISFIENNLIKVESGVLLSKISNVAYKKSLSGLEFACGIPGSIGGAVKMNAGAYGKEMKDIVITTTYLDKNLELHTINNKENKFSYRCSRFFYNKDDIIISVTLNLKPEIKEKIKFEMESNMKSRKEKQPINYPSAGSVFKREENYITAQLIDQCNLKGYNIGDACVSEKHAGFIVNKGNATAKEFLELIEYIKNKVYEKFNVKIQLEIEVLGED